MRLNWRIWLLVAAAFVMGLLRLRSVVVENALAKARSADMERALERHDARNEVENRIAADRDARERLRDDWSR